MKIDWYDEDDEPLDVIHRIQSERGITKKEAEKIVRDMMPKESDYQKKIKQAVLAKYPEAFVVKIQQGQFSTGGIPDLMVIIRGHYFGIEVKKPYFHKKSDLQKKMIEKINKAGGTADFVSYPSEALSMIGEYFRKQEGKRQWDSLGD